MAPGRSPAAGAGSAQPVSEELPATFQSSPAQLVPASWECGQALPNPELAGGLIFLTLLGLLMDRFVFFPLPES